MTCEVDAVYGGRPYDHVDTRHDMIARALFGGALEEARQLGTPDPTLATGSLQNALSVMQLLKATHSEAGNACWSPSEVAQQLGSANWPELDSLEEPLRSEVITAQFFLQACAAGGYGIQFSTQARE